MKPYVAVAKRTYSKIAEEYDANGRYYSDFYAEVLLPFERLLKRHFKDPEVLDIGCGPAMELSIMEKHGFHSLNGMDISPEMLKMAKGNVPDGSFYERDILAGGLKKRFDAVFMLSFIHLFKREDVEVVLRNVKKMLKPGGYFMLTAFNRKRPRGSRFLKKTGYGIKNLKRYVSGRTSEELRVALGDSGFRPVKRYSVKYSPPQSWRKGKGFVWVALISKVVD
ncbi:MAG: class I SAM-dependent methyltransferase [Candidatus Micrarchaeales archaeon]|nr:class I SAM-dependent methyltransferase [Candidatus Micrarchaeales archaeon]